MRLVLLREIPQDETLRRHWNALVDRVGQPQVFYTYEWALAAWRAYRATLCPLLFLAYDEQESLCGVVALATDPSGAGASFLCATTGDYCDFVSLPEGRPALVGAVLAELRKQGIGSVALANLPADSTTSGVLRQASRDQGYFCFARTGYVCAQVSLNLLERKKGEKPVAPGGKRLRRLVNAMAHTAPVRFQHARSWAALEPILPEFMLAHVARFLEIGRISNLAHPKRQEFLTELARLLSERHWLVLTRLLTGEKAVAWHYGFQFRGTWFWYQPTFDSRVEHYWPGFCMLTQVIQEAAEDPAMKTLDLGLGSEAYKAKFANASRETLYVTLHDSFFSHAASVVRDRAAAKVKTYPEIEKRAEALRTRINFLRGRCREQGAARTAVWAVRQAIRRLWARDEVLFYEWEEGPVAPPTRDAGLRPLVLHHLATAATKYIDDSETLAYILRSASRLREGKSEGFAFVDTEGAPVHFAWTTAFEGFFLSELNAKVNAPSPDAVLLFDCWTPGVMRGKGYYARAIALIANKVRNAGTRPWIFSAATNQASIRGIEQAGFKRRYSMVRRKVFNLQQVTVQTRHSQESTPVEVSAHI
ncbi:MAG TPA: GNAT family N-acetyltransferase [Candidatus Sulfotelmatobacter sp.]|nr:GNAT family N-acetyltransferase [Candidatus Sulfotelmatobacter sp.]